MFLLYPSLKKQLQRVLKKINLLQWNEETLQPKTTTYKDQLLNNWLLREEVQRKVCVSALSSSQISPPLPPYLHPVGRGKENTLSVLFGFESESSLITEPCGAAAQSFRCPPSFRPPLSCGWWEQRKGCSAQPGPCAFLWLLRALQTSNSEAGLRGHSVCQLGSLILTLPSIPATLLLNPQSSGDPLALLWGHSYPLLWQSPRQAPASQLSEELGILDSQQHWGTRFQQGVMSFQDPEWLTKQTSLYPGSPISKVQTKIFYVSSPHAHLSSPHLPSRAKRGRVSFFTL